MSNDRRKNLVREYKERKPRQGICLVRCAPTGDTWIASSRNLDAQQNSIWFGLRSGRHPNAAMQAAWKAHGESAFAYEIVELVTDDNPLLIESLLKERARHWRTTLNAGPIAG